VRFIGQENFSVADRRLANTVKWYLNPPPNFNMKIPDEVRKCIIYMGIEVPDGDKKKIHWAGTGFLVNLMAEKIPGASFLFLVTAKHVADHLVGRDFYVRANTKGGKAMSLKADKTTRWFLHPTDKAADVALFPLGLSPDEPETFATLRQRIHIPIQPPRQRNAVCVFRRG
jgi:hypothetical protein